MDVLDFIDTYIWYVAFVLIICVGVYATVRLRGIQVAGFKEMVKVTFLNRGDRREGKLSSFQVFCMSMGSRIGVGNITGPILAILVGGPGAILWMWVFALIGMATSFLETTVAQIYKVPKENGGYRGGPAYTLFHGLGMKRLGMIAAFVMILMYLVGFISGEVISMSEAVHNAFDFDGINLVFAILLTAATALLLVGGVYKIADLSVKVVPLMAIAWFAVCIVSIAFGPEGVLNGIYSIFEYAFNIPSVIGGGVGAIIITGMQRGVWSNEAGIGTITNLSGMADVKHPVSQGYTQAIGVLIDTLVSTMTALVVLSYADINALVGSGLESIPLLQSIFTDTLGSIAPYVVMIFMFIFAFTCLMSDIVIGEGNLMLIKESKVAKWGMWVLLLAVVFLSSFYASLLAVVFLSSFYASDALVVIMDILLAVCAFFNTFIMIKLARRGIEAFRDYRRQKAEGVEEPVFHKSCLSDDSGVTEWD